MENKNMAIPPRASGELIADLAEHVKILPDGIEKLGKKLLEELESGKLTVGNFSQNDYHPSSDDPWAIDWIFIVDTLNFCFWKHDDSVGWVVDGKTGYFALCAAINRAQKEGFDIVNPNFYSKITEEQLHTILRSDNETTIPLFHARVKCLHEVGTVLLQKYKGTFKTCVEQCEHSAAKLLNLVVNDFPCFRDEATYKGNRVAIYKRAQILVGDVWSCFKNKGLGHFYDIEEMTMFADYRVPQSLIYYGALEYSDDLKSILEANMLLESGSEMEVEIRGASIHAVELIKEWVLKNSKVKHQINSVLIDHFLWDFRRIHAEEIVKMGIPFHKTLGIYY